MSFQVGVLLGAYDGTQSFDRFDSSDNFVLGNWIFAITAGSYDVTTSTTYTHSSDSAIEITTGASASGQIVYLYMPFDNNDERVSTDVTTHNSVVNFWATVGDSVNSGGYMGFFNQNRVPISHDSSLNHFRIETAVNSQNFFFGVYENDSYTGNIDNTTLYIDDVLMATDVVDLCPSREQENIESQNRSDSVTLGGRYVDYKWSDQKRFNVPVRYLPSSEAALFNRWWKNGYNLMFTDNTSDENTIYITRLANTQQPFSNPMRPYNDLFEGTLAFEVIDFGLEF